MLRTAMASALLVLLSHAAAQWLTHDYQVWTAEGARRLEVALHPVAAPHVAMEGPGLRGQALETLLKDGSPVTIVDFMYTRCISVCAALGAVFQQLQSAIRDGESGAGKAPLRLLSISFDPAHDNPAVLQAYAAGLRADPQFWRFARVADASHIQALLDRYQIVVIPDGRGGYEHNAALLVVDPAGRLLRVFDDSEPDAALAFARSLSDVVSDAAKLR
jgi:protein SCO1